MVCDIDIYLHLSEERGYSVKRKIPSIRSKEITHRLCRALKDCLSVNQVITSIELQGIPLRERDISALAKGISSCNSLKHLSVEFSVIGDELVDIICRVVKNAVSITSMNFSGCGLSWKSAVVISEVVQHQAMLRHNEAWKDSLRYRRPDLDRMSGLRRITLNCNPMIGDQGAQALANVLKDDLWVKALDLQKCGLTNVGATALLEILKYNTALVVVDVRQNPLIDSDTQKNIMDQVVINTGGKATEYKWIAAEPPEDPATAKLRKKRNKTIMSNFGRKMTVKVCGTPQRKRQLSDPGSSGRNPVKPSPGIPWRAALRATRCRGYPPDNVASQTSVLDSTATATTDHSFTSPVRSPSRHHTIIIDDHKPSLIDDHDISGASYQNEMEQIRRHLAAESAARMAADKRASQMALENMRLRKEIEELQSQRGLLDDDAVINQIEQSFEQFNKFLDLLRDVGLGQLVSMAGLDNSSMPFAGQSSNAASHPLNSSESRHNTTLQMKSFLEQSRLDDTSFMSDVHVTSTHNNHHRRPTTAAGQLRQNINHTKRSSDPTLTASSSVDKLPTRENTRQLNFDELYQKAMEDTENVLSSSRAAAGGVLQSDPSSAKSSRSESEHVASMNAVNSDRSRVVSGKSDPSDRSGQSLLADSGRMQPRPTPTHRSDLNRSTDSERSKVSVRSAGSDRDRPGKSRSSTRSAERSAIDRRSILGSRRDDGSDDNSAEDLSDEYTTDDEDIEEIGIGSSSK